MTVILYVSLSLSLFFTSDYLHMISRFMRAKILSEYFDTYFKILTYMINLKFKFTHIYAPNTVSTKFERATVLLLPNKK